MTFFFVLQLLLGLGSILLTSLYSLFYVTGECYRLLHRGWAGILVFHEDIQATCVVAYILARTSTMSKTNLDRRITLRIRPVWGNNSLGRVKTLIVEMF